MTMSCIRRPSEHRGMYDGHQGMPPTINMDAAYTSMASRRFVTDLESMLPYFGAIAASLPAKHTMGWECGSEIGWPPCNDAGFLNSGVCPNQSVDLDIIIQSEILRSLQYIRDCRALGQAGWDLEPMLPSSQTWGSCGMATMGIMKQCPSSMLGPLSLPPSPRVMVPSMPHNKKPTRRGTRAGKGDKYARASPRNVPQVAASPVPQRAPAWSPQGWDPRNTAAATPSPPAEGGTGVFLPPAGAGTGVFVPGGNVSPKHAEARRAKIEAKYSDVATCSSDSASSASSFDYMWHEDGLGSPKCKSPVSPSTPKGIMQRLELLPETWEYDIWR